MSADVLPVDQAQSELLAAASRYATVQCESVVAPDLARAEQQLLGAARRYGRALRAAASAAFPDATPAPSEAP
jgi:hypothetical protein